MKVIRKQGGVRAGDSRMALLGAAVLLLEAGAAWAQAVPTIRWAGRDTVGGVLVGPPDMRSAGVAPGASRTVGAFDCGTAYANLADLLGVPVEVLASADVIAFELNGGHPGEHGGWESAQFTVRDGTRSFDVVWDAVAGASTPPGVVVADGSLTADRYRSFFGITTPSDTVVVSFVLLDLPPAIDVDSRAFRITVAGFASGEGTPDPDAVGVIVHSCGCGRAPRR